MGFSRQEYWSSLPSLLQWTTFCQTSPLWPAHLGWPHTAWLSFIELDQAVVCVIRLTSFLWLWFQCVCPLMLLATPTILLGFLLPWTWGISSRLLPQSIATYYILYLLINPGGIISHWTEHRSRQVLQEVAVRLWSQRCWEISFSKATNSLIGKLASFKSCGRLPILSKDHHDNISHPIIKHTPK